MSQVPSVTKAEEYADGSWHRLHPLTPYLQGGLAVAAVIGFFLAGFLESIVDAVSNYLVYREFPDAPPQQELPPLPVLGSILISFALVGVLVVLGIVWLWLSWLMHTVRIDDDTIEVKRGILFRTHRQARRDRVNSVAIWRPLIPRLLGLSKVEFQAAGSDANVTLAYLAHPVARELRRIVLGDESPDDIRLEGVEVNPPDEPSLRVVVPMDRLLGSLLISLETAWFALVFAVIITGGLVTGDLEWWIGAFPAGVVYLGSLVRGWARASRFRLEVIRGNVRVSYGLLSTTQASIPPDKVHAVHISQPWPWRVFGWWRVEVHRAITPGSDRNPGPSHQMVLPVGTREDAITVVELFIGDALGEGASLLDQALEGGSLTALGGEKVLAIRAGAMARLRLILSHPIHSIALVGRTLWLRTGVLITKLTIVPLERVQSAGTFRGPWHVITGLEGVECHLVPGPGVTRLIGFERPEANDFFDELSTRVIDAVAHHRSVSR